MVAGEIGSTVVVVAGLTVKAAAGSMQIPGATVGLMVVVSITTATEAMGASRTTTNNK